MADTKLKTAPSAIFQFKGDGREGAGGSIVLERVCMTRWDGNAVPSLAIYFTNGPHIRLPEKEGVLLEKQLEEYHNYFRAQL